jgi:hypothetical protein
LKELRWSKKLRKSDVSLFRSNPEINDADLNGSKQQTEARDEALSWKSLPYIAARNNRHISFLALFRLRLWFWSVALRAKVGGDDVNEPGKKKGIRGPKVDAVDSGKVSLLITFVSTSLTMRKTNKNNEIIWQI